MKKVAFLATFFIYREILEPKLHNEDLRRKELILNLLLSFLIILSLVGSMLVLQAQITKGSTYTGVKLLSVVLIVIFFIALLILSRRGHVKFPSYTLLGIQFIFSTYFGYLWGIDLPSTLLSYTLLIIMSGLLINARFGLLMSTLVTLIIGSFYYFELYGIYTPDHSWKEMNYKLDDVFEYIILLFIASGITWISNREIERSLYRARKSEKELQYERDNLEIKVLEKTNELKQAQIDKISQMYRFVEFGRLSGGLFHDLMTPLTSISLALQKFENNNSIEGEISKQTALAIRSGKKMHELLINAKKHIQIPILENTFNIYDELKSVLSFISSKSNKYNVTVELKCVTDIYLFGNSVIFNHIFTNLISNAIDACENNLEKKRGVFISAKENAGDFTLVVRDTGCGILLENISSIFEPFFTTKDQAKGVGVGLWATKHALEKYFKGTISVESRVSEGTTFIVKIPKSKESSL